jgi:hypothetical protein
VTPIATFPDGEWCAQIDAREDIAGVDVLAQSGFALVAGNLYELTFEMWGAKAVTAALDVRFTYGYDNILVHTNGTGVTVLDEKTTVGNDGVAESVTVQFTPTVSALYALQFFADDSGNSDAHIWIDNIKLVQRELVSGNELNYTFLYFENGLPTPFSHRRPGSEDNFAARANPDLVLQTGYYSLMLDCDDMDIKGYNALSGAGYLADLNKDVTAFTPADLSLSVIKDGVEYTCTGADVQTSSDQLVRLIQSNRYVQRYDHLGLIFKAADDTVLNLTGRFEVTGWADHIVFKLDFSDPADPSNAAYAAGVTQTKISLLSPASVLHETVASDHVAVLAVAPHLDTTLPVLNASSYVTEAYNRNTSAVLAVRFDEDEHAFHIDVPAAGVSYPAAIDRVDEHVIEVTNPGATAANISLVFDQPPPRAITGTIMLLCEESDGRPTGIPVQISKNWHRDTENPTIHQGSWLRGYTMLHLAGGETRRFRLRVVFGYWAGAGAVSHSQLCLIGWGKNWKWDESALGAWGETCTYDPTLHAGAAFMCDVRPAFTLGYTSGTAHSWTENSGGGDNLIYRDDNDTYRHVKRVKTAYRWSGPNMTEVLYSGVTDDDKIRYTYTARAVRTMDYHRRFHGYKYEFLQDVVSPERLVFHQMAADYYTGPDYTDYHVGAGSGLIFSGVASPGGDTYKGSPIPFNNRWLAVDDELTGTYVTSARRGIISLYSKLNGFRLPLYLHLYGNAYGTDRMMFDLSSDSVGRSYAAGDVVEGEVEFIMPPKGTNLYWGADAEFISRLETYGSNAWQAVHDECRYNAELEVTANEGNLLRNYPVEIQASTTSGEVLADFTVNGGGIGYLPVLIKGVEPGLALQAQRWANGIWTPVETADVNENDDYQAYQSVNGTMDAVFNITRPSLDLEDSWRIRIVSVVASEIYYGMIAHWPLDDGSGVVASEVTGHTFDGTVSNGTWVSGLDGGALELNGSTSRVALQSETFDSILNEITVSMWAYGDTTQPRSDTIFSALDGSGFRVLHIHIPWGDSNVYWDAGNSGGSAYDRISKSAGASEFKGGWSHWTFTKNSVSGEQKIYLDGLLWHSGAGKTRTMAGITAATLGDDTDGGRSYDGIIDDVRLYNIELSAAEIMSLYDSYPPPPPPLGATVIMVR